MPVVPMGAAEQAQALEPSGGRTAVQSSASPEGSHDIQLLVFVVAVDGPPALAGMGTGIMVLLEQGWSRFLESAEVHLSKLPWDSQAVSAHCNLHTKLQHKMQPHQLISSLVPN